MLSICLSPNKHKILSASLSSSTLKSDARRKQKCPLFPPVFCFRDDINLREPIICSDLLSILHHMSMGELSIESLRFSRIYLFFSPPLAGWLWPPIAVAVCYVCNSSLCVSGCPQPLLRFLMGAFATTPSLLGGCSLREEEAEVQHLFFCCLCHHCLLLAENGADSRGTRVAAGKAIMP